MNQTQKRGRTLIAKADKAGILDKALSARQAGRIRAYYLDGSTLEQIAAREGVHPATVWRSIDRAMRQLRQAFEQMLPGAHEPQETRPEWEAHLPAVLRENAAWLDRWSHSGPYVPLDAMRLAADRLERAERRPGTCAYCGAPARGDGLCPACRIKLDAVNAWLDEPLED